MKRSSILGLILLLMSPLTTWAVEFTVEGTMHCTDPSGVENYEFTFSVRGCQWAARLQWQDNEVMAWGHEGQLFKLMSGSFYPEGPLTSVSEGEVPVDLPYPVLPTLWTAFASHCWFDREQSRAIFPPHSSRQTPIRCQVERFRQNPRLPRKIVFTDDGVSPFGARWPAPFDKGFDVGLFAVKAAATVGELVIPKEFEVLEFSPAISPEGTVDATAEARLRGSYTVDVRSVEASVMDSFWPPVFPENSITTLDHRFGQVAVRYRADRWLSIEEAMTTTEFRRWRERHDLEYRSPLSAWRVMLILAALVAAILPLALWARWKRPVQKNK